VIASISSLSSPPSDVIMEMLPLLSRLFSSSPLSSSLPLFSSLRRKEEMEMFWERGLMRVSVILG
jgi:hypothetical protein